MDLGRKAKDFTVPASPEKHKVVYPTLSLNDTAAEAFSREHDVELGKEYTGTIKFKVTGQRSDSFGRSLSLDILEINDVVEERSEGQGSNSERRGRDTSSESASDDDGDENDVQVLGVKLPKRKHFKELVKASSNFLD